MVRWDQREVAVLPSGSTSQKSRRVEARRSIGIGDVSHSGISQALSPLRWTMARKVVGVISRRTW